MSNKQRPDTRVVLKPKSGGPTITLAAYWTDRERPSGGLDNRIRRMKIELENGEIVDVVNTPRESATHYANLYMGEPPASPQRRQPKRDEAPDLCDDDIPW